MPADAHFSNLLGNARGAGRRRLLSDTDLLDCAERWSGPADPCPELRHESAFRAVISSTLRTRDGRPKARRAHVGFLRCDGRWQFACFVMDQTPLYKETRCAALSGSLTEALRCADSEFSLFQEGRPELTRERFTAELESGR